MEKMYSFIDTAINYEEKNIDAVFAFKNLYFSTKDILKIFNINLETFNRCIYQVCNNILNEAEIRYVYTSENGVATIYYSLEAITYLGFIKNNEDIIKFIMWANKTLRNMLIKSVKFQPKVPKTTIINTSSFSFYRNTEYYINEINEASKSSEIKQDEDIDNDENIYDIQEDILRQEINGFQKIYHR